MTYNPAPYNSASSASRLPDSPVSAGLSPLHSSRLSTRFAMDGAPSFASTGMQHSPSGSSVAPAKRKKGGSKGKGKDESSEEDEDGEGEGRKAKRNRMALSCKECKRRKIKCDRAMPSCGPCSKRGASSTCTWDIFSGTGNGDGFLPPSIARTADLDAVVARLAHVEAYLKTLPPNLASFRPLAPSLQDTNYGDPSRKFIAGGGGAGVGREQGKEETFSDTEDAAVNLENGVFGGRLGGGAGEKKVQGAQRVPIGGTGGGMAGASNARSQARFGAPALELTKALTSIIAAERPHDTFSKAHLNVEFDASPAEVEQARREELRKIYRALPNRQSVVHLVNLYFGRVSWLFHHLHAPTFLIELEAFHELCDAGRSDEIDPLFIGLLLMVICVALDSTHTSRSPLSLDPTQAGAPSPLNVFTEEQLRALPERWFAAAQRALTLAEWETVPRIRTIQTIVLFTQYLQLCSSNRGQPAQLVTWLAGAIRLAQVLGLHLLGSNPETMPPQDDPAFPPGKNSLKRESAKRLWGVLVYQDWLGASSKNRSYLVSPFHFDTDDPLNLNDSDLSSIDWRVNPSPHSVLTDSSSDRVRIAMSRQVRKVFDAVVLTRDVTYETVLELDRGYRSILDSLPDRWTLESSAEETEQPMLRFQRHFALEGLHNRIFRLHRPFSTRGYSQAKYRFSTDACIKSARVVVVSTHNIADATRDIWYTYSHVMGAALVLFNDLFQSIDHDASASEIDSKKDVLNLADEIFSRSSEITSESLRAVVEQGSKIMTGLFRAEESRRVGRAAQALLAASGGVSLDPEDEAEVETFADVLQRISRSLNTQTAPHRGTPPPTRNIPTATTLRVPPLFPPLPPTAVSSALLATEHIPTASSFDFNNPWPFPSSNSGADDLSLSFFQDLSGPLDGEALEFWNPYGQVQASATPFQLPAQGAVPVQGGWTGQEGAIEGAQVGGGAQMSSLLDQLGGGW